MSNPFREDITNIFKRSVDIHKVAREKGWWEKERSVKTIFQLIAGEVSEASEEVRSGKPLIYGNLVDGGVTTDLQAITELGLKPEGEAVELADAAIRAMDSIGFLMGLLGLERDVLDNSEETMGKAPPTDDYFTNQTDLLDDHFDLTGHLYSCFDAIERVSSEKHFSKMGKVGKFMSLSALFSFVVLIDYYFEKKNWVPLSEVCDLKDSYNKTRAYRHGGKKA